MAFKDPQKSKEYHHLYYMANRERTLARDKEHYLSHQDEIKARVNARRIKHRDDDIARKRAAYHADIEKSRAKGKLAIKKRYSTIRGRLYISTFTRIRIALDRTPRCDSVPHLLGCDWDQFKVHLESLWRPGMSWENHGRGGWNIDHIRPCASFDLSDPIQQRACFHWSNTRPLWEKDNLGRKLIPA